MLKFTDISWGKIQMFYRPAYIYMYRVYNTKTLNISTTKMIILFESTSALLILTSMIFNSFISDWAGPHDHFWASANIKIKLDWASLYSVTSSTQQSARIYN